LLFSFFFFFFIPSLQRPIAVIMGSRRSIQINEYPFWKEKEKKKEKKKEKEKEEKERKKERKKKKKGKEKKKKGYKWDLLLFPSLPVPFCFF